MAIQFMDGFDHYGVGATGLQNMLAGPWADIVAFGDLGAPLWGARTGPCAFSPAGDNSNANRRILPTARSAVFLSCGYSVDGLPNTDFVQSICSFRDGSNHIIVNVYCQNTGVIVVTDDVNNILGTSSGPLIVAHNWHYLEMLFNAGTGAFTLRVDDSTGGGTPAIAITGLGALSNIAQISIGEIGTHSGDTQSWYDDLLVRDTTGGTNDTFLGDRRIATLFANADTTTHGWTPSYYHKFGAGILRLSYVIPGTAAIQSPGAYVRADASTQLDIGGSDFTLETMIRFDQLPTTTNYATIFGRWDASRNLRSYRLVYGGPGFNNSSIQFDTSTDGTASGQSTPIVYPWSPQANVWYHIALCRSAGELLLFVDGVQLGLPITDGTTYFGAGTERFNVGIEQADSGNSGIPTTKFIGRMDETRFTNGTGRYTTTFTPPSAAFPRGSSDPDWAQVVVLMGYDSGINDESSFSRAITSEDGPASIIPADGPLVGQYSTVNKAVPDDGSFIEAGYTFASNILTMTTQPADGNIITLGTTDGTTPAVYQFKNTMAAAFDVKIGASAQITLQNFLNAVNAGPGSGTAYFAGTTSNFDVNAALLPVGQIEVFANTAGTGGNAIVSTHTGTAASWASTTLLGGLSLPGPTSFKLQRPPNNTTVISGLQMTVRALKTDAGTADIQTTFIGGLGGTAAGIVHPLTTSVSYYQDIVETDPDTMGPVSPTTIINGQFEINRTT